MISKRDIGAFLIGVLVGNDGVKFCVHAFYIAVIIALSVGIYLK